MANPTAAKPEAKPGTTQTPPDNMDGVKSFLAMTFGTDAKNVVIEPPKGTPPAKPPPEPTTEAAPPVEPDAPPTAAKKPDTAPPAPRAPAPPTPLTLSQVAELAAKTAVQTMKAAEPPKPPPAPEPPNPDAALTAEQKKTLAVIERMSTIFPDQYKNATEEYRKSLGKLTEYQQKWETEHPGEDFDQDADEHSDFMEKNIFGWEEEHYQEAQLDIKAEEKIAAAEQRRKVADEKAKSEEQHRQEELNNSRGAVEKIKFEAAKDYLKSLGPEFSDLLKDDGKEDSEKINALRESSPDHAKIVEGFWNRLDAEVPELHALMSGLKEFDPNNKLHAEIGQFATQQEKVVMGWTPEQRIDEKGRPFLPLNDYYAIPKEQRDGYWTFTPDKLAKLRAVNLAGQIGKRMKAEEDTFARVAKRKGIQLPANGTPPKSGAPAANGARSSNGTAPSSGPETPTGGGGPRVAPRRGSGSSTFTDPLSAMFARTL